MPIPQDLAYALELKDKFISERQWMIRSNSHYEAYKKSKSLPPQQRAKKLLAQFDSLIETLYELVANATAAYCQIISKVPDSTLKERAKLVEDHVRKCVITPNIDRQTVRRWLFEACGEKISLESLDRLQGGSRAL